MNLPITITTTILSTIIQLAWGGILYNISRRFVVQFNRCFAIGQGTFEGSKPISNVGVQVLENVIYAICKCRLISGWAQKIVCVTILENGNVWDVEVSVAIRSRSRCGRVMVWLWSITHFIRIIMHGGGEKVLGDPNFGLP